jgi:hypothetical protein
MLNQPFGVSLGVSLVSIVLVSGSSAAWQDDAADVTDVATGSGRVVIDGPAPPEAPEVITRDESGGATIRAIRLERALTVDGRLDDAVYSRVPGISGFIQQDPDEGAPATEKTEVWVLYDDRNIYVAGRCWDSHPERMVATEMRRDHFGIFNNENLAVIFDTFYDRRNAFFFYANPIGGIVDSLIVDEGDVNKDWNTVWDAKTARFDQGWTVEMVFPFKSLRYAGSGPQVWGINFRRVIRWKNEFSYLTPVPNSLGPRGITKISSAGTLVGLETPPKSQNLELKPYGITSLLTDREADPPKSNEFDGDIGFDLKYGLTRGLVADFTYNTDFAQVEADEQQVNLTRFSLFFPEKREFFLEGQGIFSFGGAQAGGGGGGGGRPLVQRGSAGPNNTPILFFSRSIGLNSNGVVPILAGGRVTGRVGDYSVGLLSISTDDHAPADAVQTNFSVVRLKRDILRRSSVGVLGTTRSVATSGSGSNQVFGLDANLAFYENLRINSYYAVSRTDELSGEDASYNTELEYDGDRYGLTLQRLVVQENFNPEIGFLRRQNFQQNFALARFSPRPASIDWLRKISWQGSFEYTTDNDQRLETRVAKFSYRMDFENADQFFLDASDSYEFLPEPFEISSRITLPVAGYGFRDVRLSYQLGPQRPISGNFAVQTGSFFSGSRDEVSYRGRLEITPQLTIEPGITFNWVELDEGSFNTRLVSTRLSYTIDPRSFVAAFLQYNSTSNSLSSNIRFRWEYQPGSELFVVYSDQRDTRTSGYPGLENRSFVVKLTRLFRF